MMKRKFLVGFAALFVLNLGAQDIDMEQMNHVRKLLVAESNIARYYVDKVNEEKLVEDAIKGMLEELDPHSTYSTAKEVKALNESLQGNFDGVGIQFNVVEDTLFVVQPTVGGPSEKVGIMAGDRIIAVNDTAIAGVKMSREEIMTRLRGPKGTHVVLKVIRRGIDDTLTFEVVRDKIVTKSVDVSFILSKGIGYVRVNSFGATTHDEFVAALNRLKKEGMKNLIIDLQGNGGGYLKAAVDIANELLQEGQEIVYTEGRTQPRYDFRATGGGIFPDGKVVVLIDETSASASEILTGAIQDWDRGMVVGRRSFGKGLVQRPIDLPDGSMIRLTIARYYTPSGRSIQRPYKDKKEYETDLVNRYNKGELTNRDSIHFPDSLRYKTLKLGRTVYGGGGIMPDYFVPLDTMAYTKYHRELAAKGSIINTTLRYVDTHRDEILKDYPKFKTYLQKFEVSESLLNELKAQGVKDGVKEVSDEDWAKSKKMLQIQMKALIARDVWDMNEYYLVMAPVSDPLQKALQLLEQEGK